MWVSGLLIGCNKLNILHLLLEWQLDHRDFFYCADGQATYFLMKFFIVRFAKKDTIIFTFLDARIYSASKNLNKNWEEYATR